GRRPARRAGTAGAGADPQSGSRHPKFQQKLLRLTWPFRSSRYLTWEALLDAASRRLDDRPRTGRNRHPDDLHRPLELSRRDDLHALDALRHESRSLERLERHVAVEARELVHAHLVPGRGLARPEPDLRQPSLQRHLAALEADLVVAAGPRVLTLRAASRRLALARARAAPDSGRRLTAARSRLQFIQPHVKPPRPGPDRRP